MTTTASSEISRFIVGRRYSCRSLCDYDCVFSFDVVSRTEKTVSLKDSSGQVTRRKVRLLSGTTAPIEACDPHGRYSMSPVLIASDRT